MVAVPVPVAKQDRVLTADEFVHCEDYGGSQTVGTENDPTSGQIRKRKANSATVSLCCKEHSSQESISIGPGYDLQPEPALVEVYQSPSQPSKKHSTANNAARLDERQVQHALYHGRPWLKDTGLRRVASKPLLFKQAHASYLA